MDVPDDLREHSVAHGIDLNIIVAEQLAEVFGKCWDSLGGFVKFHGVAIISINGSHKYAYILVALLWVWLINFNLGITTLLLDIG